MFFFIKCVFKSVIGNCQPDIMTKQVVGKFLVSSMNWHSEGHEKSTKVGKDWFMVDLG